MLNELLEIERVVIEPALEGEGEGRGDRGPSAWRGREDEAVRGHERPSRRLTNAVQIDVRDRRHPAGRLEEGAHIARERECRGRAVAPSDRAGGHDAVGRVSEEERAVLALAGQEETEQRLLGIRPKPRIEAAWRRIEAVEGDLEIPDRVNVERAADLAARDMAGDDGRESRLLVDGPAEAGERREGRGRGHTGSLL